ncbi:MAG: hypothetical protein CM15mP58_15080 [Burkholderiaceae bacterium]|nr:MAG: hypothetical protein CM15mP58_15080 [Burkholderiaceae bacterium]
MFWLSLNPPDAKYGLGFPPLAEGGWFLMTGSSLPLQFFCGGLECTEGL